MHKHRFAALVLLLACAAPCAHGQSLAPEVGAWELRICKGEPCVAGRDSGTFVATGVLVLGSSFEFLTAAPDSLRRVLFSWSSGFGAPNGCWVLGAGHMERHSFASIARTTGVSWRVEPTDSTLRLFLYRSPDAWHTIRVRIVGDSLFGSGASGGAGIMEVDWPADVVVGRRIGDADATRCLTGAVNQLREWASARRRSNDAWY